MMNLADLPEYVEHFRQRILQDALTEATAAYWVRRAWQYERARPQPGQFTGQATAQEIAALDADLATKALNCRRKARLMLGGDLYDLMA